MKSERMQVQKHSGCKTVWRGTNRCNAFACGSYRLIVEVLQGTDTFTSLQNVESGLRLDEVLASVCPRRQ
jgi:hypothetical protein